MAEFKFITYRNSVQRAVHYRCNDDDDGDHNESYERSVNYSPLRLR